MPSMRETSESLISAMPTVDDAHVVVERERGVARLDVAVNDAAAMRVVQAFRALEQDLDDVVDAQQLSGRQYAFSVRAPCTCSVTT